MGARDRRVVGDRGGVRPTARRGRPLGRGRRAPSRSAGAVGGRAPVGARGRRPGRGPRSRRPRGVGRARRRGGGPRRRARRQQRRTELQGRLPRARSRAPASDDRAQLPPAGRDRARSVRASSPAQARRGDHRSPRRLARSGGCRRSAVYGATKAFDLLLGEALRVELGGRLAMSTPASRRSPAAPTPRPDERTPGVDPARVPGEADVEVTPVVAAALARASATASSSCPGSRTAGASSPPVWSRGASRRAPPAESSAG